MANVYFALIELTAAAETDLTGPGTWDTIGGTFALDSQSSDVFELDENDICKVTYGGANAARVSVDFMFSINATATGEIALAVFVDDVQVQEHVHTKPGNTNITPAGLPTLVTLQSGSTLEVKMSNHANDTNATAEHASVRLTAFSSSSYNT